VRNGAVRKIVVAWGTLLLAPLLARADDTAITIDSGPITGLVADEVDGVRVYKGIPFAAPATGPNRWREPQPAAAWTEPRACTEFGPTCPQSDALDRRLGLNAPRRSEDCLYLNVFTPARGERDRLPVMVWIHGGGFSVGSANLYDGSTLAQGGAVVVTINYRLGTFGFLAHKELTAESPRGASGNLGLLDMIAALQWVQRNVERFGGDKGNVTIFGQSSGGSAVCYLLASSEGRGLFHRAIAESGGAYDPMPDLKATEAAGEKLFSAMGCDSLAAAREKSWQDVLAAAQPAGVRFGVIRDGKALPRHPIDIFKSREQSNVPLVIGSNANESDAEYTVSARFFGREHSRLNPGTFRYVFSKPSSDPNRAGQGAPHGAEIAYVFNRPLRPGRVFDDADKALARTISGMWLQFAKTGDPSGAADDQAVRWPSYDAATDSYIDFGAQVTTGKGFRTELCDKLEREIEAELAKQP